MSFADHFTAVAARYAAYRPHYPAALVDVLADRSARRVAWEVGCGSGQLSVALAARFERVIATDPAQAQLASAPAHPGIEYRCVSAEASGLDPSSVDLVVAAQAAHWFEWPAFLAEAERVGRPGALVALVSYGNAWFDGDAALRAYHRDVVAPYWPAGRAHVDNGYRDLVMPWPHVDAPAIEMAMSWTRDELVGYVTTWSATWKLVESQGPAPVEQFAAQLAATWPDGERRMIRWPLTIKLARR